MKKNPLSNTGMLLVLLLCMMLPLLCACQYKQYESGRDTVASFGDGSFQLVRGRNPANQKETLSLSIHPYNCFIIDSVKAYSQQENTAYVIGNYQYVAIDLENNIAEYFEDISPESYMPEKANMIRDGAMVVLSTYDAFSEEEQTQFAALVDS